MSKYLMLGASLFLAASATFAAAPNKEDPPFRQRGEILVEMKGRGVYTYDGDKVANQSDCFAQCRLLWPPVYAEDEAKPKGSFTILVRKDDGKRQWAFKGKPLYRWVSDVKRGDAGGDGVAGVWRLVKVLAKPSVQPALEKTAEKTIEKPKQK
ncbi:MAG: COG4315 family predicted lipoprotein [Arenimonas sp.]